jgi:hypothetical protein
MDHPIPEVAAIPISIIAAPPLFSHAALLDDPGQLPPVGRVVEVRTT